MAAETIALTPHRPRAADRCSRPIVAAVGSSPSSSSSSSSSWATGMPPVPFVPDAGVAPKGRGWQWDWGKRVGRAAWDGVHRPRQTLEPRNRARSPEVAKSPTARPRWMAPSSFPPRFPHPDLFLQGQGCTGAALPRAMLCSMASHQSRGLGWPPGPGTATGSILGCHQARGVCHGHKTPGGQRVSPTLQSPGCGNGPVPHPLVTRGGSAPEEAAGSSPAS